MMRDTRKTIMKMLSRNVLLNGHIEALLCFLCRTASICHSRMSSVCNSDSSQIEGILASKADRTLTAFSNTNRPMNVVYLIIIRLHSCRNRAHYRYLTCEQRLRLLGSRNDIMYKQMTRGRTRVKSI